MERRDAQVERQVERAAAAGEVLVELAPDVVERHAQHARNLRSWVFTIATNVAMDELRAKPQPPVDGVPVTELRRDAFRELEHLTGDLPPTERAAVVLRYGYDLPYAQIADALGSSEEAARAAASSGVRRLRRTHERHA